MRYRVVPVVVGVCRFHEVDLARCAGPREYGAAGAHAVGVEIIIRIVAADRLGLSRVAAAEVDQGFDGAAVGETEFLILAGTPRARARAAGAGWSACHAEV